MVRVAIPVFKDDVAPRFGYTDEFLIADIEDGGVLPPRRAVLVESSLPGKLDALRGLGAEVLLCGGFERRFVPVAQSLGLHIVAGLSGSAEDVLVLFGQGEEFHTFEQGHPGWLCGCPCTDRLKEQHTAARWRKRRSK